MQQNLNRLAIPGDKMISYNDKVLKVNTKWLLRENTNPLNLPAYNIRCLFEDGYTPTQGTSRVQVSVSPNIWDIAQPGSWAGLFDRETHLLEVLGANSEGVTNIANMFTDCSNLRKVALFDTSSMTDFQGLFYHCSSLVTIPKFDSRNVTAMDMMFDHCSSLKYIPLLNTSNVTDMNYMFSDCSALIAVPFFDTSKVTTMREMFLRCVSLRTVPTFNTHNVTDMRSMFLMNSDEESVLESIPPFDLTSCTIVTNMYSLCVNVSSGILDFYNYASTIPALQDIDAHRSALEWCGSNNPAGKAELDQVPQDWKGIS